MSDLRIGIGVVSFNRASYFRQSIEAILATCPQVEVYAHVDGPARTPEMMQRYTKLAKRYTKQGVQTTIARKNEGVGRAKNELLRRMIAAGHEWIFLAEDDVLPQSPEAITGYVSACENSGLSHLMFHAHGPGNTFDIGSWGEKVLLWPDYVGAWCIYSRESLLSCGLMDEGFHNAWEHVEHSLRLAQGGFTTPWRAAADAKGSEEWLQEIPESIENSSIPMGDKRVTNIEQGREYWMRAHPDTYHQVFDQRGQIRQETPASGRLR